MYDLCEYEKDSNKFKVDPIDESRYDDHHQGETNANGETRSGYRLHLGSVSWGCITINNFNKNRFAEWNIVLKIIRNTSTSEVPKREGYQKYIPFTSRFKYGTINVIGSDKIPETSK